MPGYALLHLGYAGYYHRDHLGSAQIITDQTQQVVWAADYSPFGMLESGEGDGEGAVENNWRFPGQYADGESGCYYNYFRDYDPTLGRYLESDPIGLGGGFNTFGYVYQSPFNYSDSYGLASISIAMECTVIAGDDGFRSKVGVVYDQERGFDGMISTSDEVLGLEGALGLSFDLYTGGVEGTSMEGSVPKNIGPYRIDVDFAVSDGPVKSSSIGFDISVGGGASASRMTTTNVSTSVFDFMGRINNGVFNIYSF